MKTPKNWVEKNFTHCISAVDLVIFSIIDDQLHCLLLTLKQKPFEGLAACPGGLVRLTESLEEAAERVLREKTDLHHNHLEQLYTFGDVHRDPLGRVVSVAYLVLLPHGKAASLRTTDQYSDIQWVPVQNLPNLAYDHARIISVALDRLKAKLGYSTVARGLLPSRFTLTDLQKSYEIILARSLDKRNFRKKIHELKFLKKIKGTKQDGPGRPAQLYSFKNTKTDIIHIL